MAGGTMAALRRLNQGANSGLDWRLRWCPVCASTETELDRWLEKGARPPLAVLAARQVHGHGQRGRAWSSPPGGIWISAALPWPEQAEGTAALGPAVAVGLALQLEALGLLPRLKWPNDLLLDGRKVAGLLPRLRLRGGRIRWAQVGLGLNGHNRVPPGAVSVATALGRGRSPGSTAALGARVLTALDWAARHSLAPERVRFEAQRRLELPIQAVPFEGELWRAVGLGLDGALELARGGRRARMLRLF